ncbi:hypothetical protein [uncultured Polaribacter sp.]|uniref:hypothetical protein n=1 Tax=uncultured Polaribacter sp. TaxID=174711 RepID=UPI0026106B2C|nr:hypothetical protein [uncultured Polaribacter sp.]
MRNFTSPKAFFFYILLFCCFIGHSQTNFNINNDYLLFEDAVTKEPVLVYNDSMAVSGFDFNNHFKTQFPNDFSVIDYGNYQLQLDSINYLVDSGCGVVISYANKKFKRIDKSFRHQNQYGAVPFVHNKNIYLWGGYGLFTHKNILTYYDFVGNEWLLKYYKNTAKLVPRYQSFSVKKGSDLYILDGVYENYALNKKKTIEDPYVWRLDLNTFTWFKEKKYNTKLPVFTSTQITGQQFTRQQTIVYVTSKIYEIDLFKNTVKTFEIRNFKNIKALIFHPTSDKVSYVYFSNNKNIANSELYSDFRGNLLSETPLYVDETGTQILKYLGILSLVCLLVFLTIKWIKRVKETKNQLTYYHKNNLFVGYKKSPLKLSPLNAAVLKVFISHENTFFPLQELSDVLSEDLKEDNYITINKRRERVLKDLKFELSDALKIPKDNIFTTRTSQLDKRMREIKINVTFLIK